MSEEPKGISIKRTETEQGIVIAACDEELLGKTLGEGEQKLEVSESFYGGEIVTLEEFSDKLKEAKIANLVGEKCVGKAIELGLVLESAVKKIGGIPHAQYYMVSTA